MRGAVGGGGRGISKYDIIVRTVCDELRRAGATVFIVPAMGSHGGATDAGQLDVLAHYGITEQAMGVPIRSSMEVVELGAPPLPASSDFGATSRSGAANPTGEFVLFQDRHAAGADAIVPV